MKRSQESLRLLIPIQVEERQARRATDLAFGSILKRKQDSLRSLSILKRLCFDCVLVVVERLFMQFLDFALVLLGFS